MPLIVRKCVRARRKTQQIRSKAVVSSLSALQVKSISSSDIGKLVPNHISWRSCGYQIC
jgi:hypothetical protein